MSHPTSEEAAHYSRSLEEWAQVYEAERPRAEEQVRRRLARLRAEREQNSTHGTDDGA